MKRLVPIFEDILSSPSIYRPRASNISEGSLAKVPFFSIIPVLLIEQYQKRTVNRPHQCNFYPTCSEYSRICFIRYGLVIGFRMTRERIRHCNDFYSDWPRMNKP